MESLEKEIDNIKLIKKYIKKDLILLFLTLITNANYKLSCYYKLCLNMIYYYKIIRYKVNLY